MPLCAHTLPTSERRGQSSKSKMTNSTAAAVGGIVITTPDVPHRVLSRCRGDRARFGRGSGHGG